MNKGFLIPNKLAVQTLLDCVASYEDLWVFAYGSLLWRPGFEYQERRTATLKGFGRSLCIWSWYHRGTIDRPGLVFGLDEMSDEMSAGCQGCVFKVGKGQTKTTLDYLAERELIGDAYIPRMVSVVTEEGVVDALTFVVNRQSKQYTGELSVEQSVRVVLQAHGHSGDNRAYVCNTWQHLQALGIQDSQLQRVYDCLRLADRDGISST